MSARNLTLVDLISLMEKQSGRFKEDQVLVEPFGKKGKMTRGKNLRK